MYVGTAGLVAALVYAGLTFLVSPEDAILIQLFVPLLMLTAYLFILGKPGNILPTEKDDSTLPTSHVKDTPPYSKTDHTVADTKTLPGENQGGDDTEMDSKPLLDEIEGEDFKPLLGEMDDSDDGTRSKLWSKLKWSRLKSLLFNKEEAGLVTYSITMSVSYTHLTLPTIYSV